MGPLKRRGTEPPASAEDLAALRRRVKALEAEVQESRALNRRLADVVDVVTELLVPAMDRDDGRVTEALSRLRGEEAAGPAADS
ncbi:MAG: DUF6752 domain-containing protein [Nocardioidaceae bacterium]